MPRSPLRFDAAVAALATWMVGGLYVDGWAHAHRPDLESFFTPWHALFYSGWAALAALLAWTWWRRGAPDGYAPSVAGTMLFAAGGAGDLLWHQVFGVEVSVEALVSPTHLMLAIGMGLMAAGPLRAAWRRGPPVRFRDALPMLVSAALVLALVVFFTQFSSPLVRPWALPGNEPVDPVWHLADGRPLLPTTGDDVPSADFALASGLGAVVLQSLVVAGFALALVLRGVPVGGLTVVLGAVGVGLGLMRSTLPLALTLLAAGLVGDALLAALKPNATRPKHVRLFALALPASWILLYLAAIALSTGTWWSWHAAAGAVVLAGLAGLLLTYVDPTLDGNGATDN